VVLHRAKRLARQRDTGVSAPVEERLRGWLAGDVSQEEYRRHLDEKYGS